MSRQGLLDNCALLALIALTGCVGDQRNRLDVHPRTVSESVPEPRSTPSQEPSVSSSNAVQQNQTGAINAAVGKVAETFEASLLKLETRMDAKMEAQASAIAGIGNDIRNSITTSTSGRDTNNTQFTPEMADTIKSVNRNMFWGGVALVALILTHEWMSHRRGKRNA